MVNLLLCLEKTDSPHINDLIGHSSITLLSKLKENYSVGFNVAVATFSTSLMQLNYMPFTSDIPSIEKYCSDLNHGSFDQDGSGTTAIQRRNDLDEFYCSLLQSVQHFISSDIINKNANTKRDLEYDIVFIGNLEQSATMTNASSVASVKSSKLFEALDNTYRLHLITFSSKLPSEFDNLQVVKENLTSLSRKLNGQAAHIQLPHGQAKFLVERAIKNLADTKFLPYIGKLECGHLFESICLFPTTSEIKFPSKLVIVGFIDQSLVINLPARSRHIITPTTLSANTTTRRRRINQNGSFCKLLEESLTSTSKVAVISLDGADLFAIVYPRIMATDDQRLILSVLHSGLLLPGSIPFASLKRKRTDDNDSISYNNHQVSSSMVNTEDNKKSAVVLQLNKRNVEILFKEIFDLSSQLPKQKSKFYELVESIRYSIIIQRVFQLIPGLIKQLQRCLVRKKGTLSGRPSTRSSTKLKSSVEDALLCLNDVIDQLKRDEMHTISMTI